MKRFGLQNPICSLPFDKYEALAPTEQHAVDKGIEAEQRWLKLSFDVCDICQGCHLTTMRKVLVEFGHTHERQRTQICGSCENNPKKKMTQNRVKPYWMDRHGLWHTTVPEQLSGLTFAEKIIIAVASSHISLIHLKNDTLGSRRHCVAVEQQIANILLVLPRHPSDLDFFSVRRSGGSSDQEVYEKIFKVQRKKVVAALYWLVEHNVMYQ
jgi:hypothetical protein